MLLYNVAAADREIKLNNTINQVHTDSIRELATQEGQAGLVASGGRLNTFHLISLCVRHCFSLTHTHLFPQVSRALSAFRPSSTLRMLA